MSEDLTDKLPKKNGEILTAIRNLDEHVGKIDSRLGSLEQRFDGLEKKFDGLEKKFDGLEKKFDGLEKKVDERLHDTRPIWHKVVAEIGELQTGQTRLEVGQKNLEQSQSAMREQQSTMREQQAAMREQIVDLNSVVRAINRDQIVINDSLRRIQLDFRDFDERLFKFINSHNQQNSQT